MAAPASALDLTNLALLKLYAKPITSLNDSSVAALVSNLTYDQERQSLLRNFIWPFAIVRGSAAIVVGPAPKFDYQAAYQLPNDCLRILQVGCFGRLYHHSRRDLNGRQLLMFPTDCHNTTFTPPASIDLMYTSDCTDVTLMDSLFRECMILKLATALCMPITANQALLEMLEKAHLMSLGEAQAISNQERPAIVIESDPVAQARIADTWEYRDIRVDPSVWGSEEDE